MASDTFICSNCRAIVRVNALACPQCGADGKTGWSEDANQGSADIPAGYSGNKDFDYEGFMIREFGKKKKKTSFPWGKTLLTLILMIALLMMALR